MTILSRAALCCLVAVLPLAGAAAQAREVTGLQTFRLDNGLEVFVVENHTVPLARIQVTFRTGAISQTPQTAGLFHLYEHMLFKGNRAYPNQTALQAAMKDLGVADWNGGTTQESVSYYFTVPSDRTGKGIEFWADAVRSPLLDPVELQTEKDVVVSEILGGFSDPGNIYGSAIQKALYWKFPWRKDVAGSETLVRSATVQMLRDMRDTWYVPNNAALFVGGDVDPGAVRAAAQKLFGDWKRAKDPWASPPPPHPALQKDLYMASADEQMYSGLVSVDLRFGGPDVQRSAESTYAADVWSKLLEDPNGRFRTTLFRKVPGQYNKDYISAGYLTRRDGGALSFSTYLTVLPGQDTFQRAAAVKKAFVDEMAAIASDPAYFSTHDYQVLTRQIADDRIWERETADGFIGTLAFWWASASTAYYLGYNDALQKITPADITRFISTYILDRPSVLSVRMNQQDFDREGASAARQGWSSITKDNAYWWADQAKGDGQ
ncbi:MAG: pitrilysin family protein [Spirochaetia bacterium]|jgi:zinc protease